MKIGILKTGHVPQELLARYGEYPNMFVDLLAGKGFEFSSFDVVENRFPASIFDADAWLITGSKHGAYEDHSWIKPLEQFIREAYTNNIPLVGICFGHQIMAQALGGKVTKYPGGWGLGQVTYSFDDNRLDLLALHQDQVIEKPQNAEIIASSDFCKNAGLAYHGKHGVQALSFQPHPEFTPEFMSELLKLRAGDAFPEELVEKSLRSIRQSNDSGKIAEQIADFFLSFEHKNVA